MTWWGGGGGEEEGRRRGGGEEGGRGDFDNPTLNHKSADSAHIASRCVWKQKTLTKSAWEWVSV